MTYAVVFLAWIGAGFALCWVWDVAKVPGERQRMAWGVRVALLDHYLLSSEPVAPGQVFVDGLYA